MIVYLLKKLYYKFNPYVHYESEEEIAEKVRIVSANSPEGYFNGVSYSLSPFSSPTEDKRVSDLYQKYIQYYNPYNVQKRLEERERALYEQAINEYINSTG